MNHPRWDIHRLTHLAELGWIALWLASGALFLAGMNLTFAGDRNLWQIAFGFLK